MASRRAEPVAEEEAERDYTLYAGKAPTGTMEAFADWLIEEVGLEFPNQKAEDHFRDGVRLGGTLRMEFQASEYWRSDERNPRSDAGKAARASANGSAKEETAGKPAATRRGRAAAKEPDEPEAKAESASKPAARSGRRNGATASTRSGRRGSSKPAEATGEGTEAPY